MKKIKLLLKTNTLGLRALITLFITFVFISIPVARALDPITPYDINQINLGQHYRSTQDIGARTCTSYGGSSSGRLFFIGDSLTLGLSDAGILDMAVEAGYGVSTDVDATDPVVRTGQSIEARGGWNTKRMENRLISSKTERLEPSNVGIFVVSLGTNDYGIERKNQYRDMIDFLHERNNQAQIIWVNTKFYHPQVASYQEINADIDTVAEEYAFVNVLDYASAAEADSTLDPPTSGSDQIHLSPGEYENKARWIIENLPSDSNNPTACGGSVVLSGENNEEKVWNFMTEKGLSQIQIAGFMGNMQAEASFEPRRLEYAWSDSPHLSSSVPACRNEKCQPGWGIVQWTAEGRKAGLRTYLESIGAVNLPLEEQSTIDTLLSAQLEYVWIEIQGACCSLKQSFRSTYGSDATVLEALSQSNTVSESTRIITYNYEIPGNIDETYRERVAFACNWLAKYGTVEDTTSCG